MRILTTYGGETFTNVAQKAREMSMDILNTVQFEFNGITCLVDEQTNLDHLYRDYCNAHRMQWEIVGPDCQEKYDKKTEALLNQRNKEAQGKEEIRKQEYELKCKNERAEFDLLVDGISFEVKDVKEWQDWRDKNTDGYGNAIFEFAESWARLMQYYISKGQTVEQCAKETSFKFGYLGMSGYQYSAAVQCLIVCWKYGADLKKWHESR